MDPERTKKRLQKKLEKRRNNGNINVPESNTTDSTESVDFMKMLNEVNKMFKTNPNMIQKVSKCVNNIMENKELMETLVSKANLDIDNDEINDEIDDQTAQTLHSKALAEQLAALSNESKQ